MDNSKIEYKCLHCDSKSSGTPGTCCGGKEREKVCNKCEHAHEGKVCSCGCAAE